MRASNKLCLALSVMAVTMTAYPVYAEFPSIPEWIPKFLGAQFNGVYQYMPDFHSPYEGPNSLSFQENRGKDFTQTYGLYLGSQLASRLQAYLDVEWFRGNGISDGVGLGGYVNGDVIRAGSSNLPKDPYVARLYL
ncbi:MAG TPA: hypothetical protein VEI57_09645, partial [Nitrospirota bacterium]|nr:hypothetical protein [Nitrospirota bacterium]